MRETVVSNCAANGEAFRAVGFRGGAVSRRALRRARIPRRNNGAACVGWGFAPLLGTRSDGAVLLARLHSAAPCFARQVVRVAWTCCQSFAPSPAGVDAAPRRNALLRGAHSRPRARLVRPTPAFRRACRPQGRRFARCLEVSRGCCRFVRKDAPTCAALGPAWCSYPRGFARGCCWRLLGWLPRRAAAVMDLTARGDTGSGQPPGARGCAA